MRLYHAHVESDQHGERILNQYGPVVVAAGGNISLSRNFGSPSTRPTLVVFLPESAQPNIPDVEFFEIEQKEQSHAEPAQEPGDSGRERSGGEGEGEGADRDEATA